MPQAKRSAPPRRPPPAAPDPETNGHGDAPISGHVVNPLIPVIHILSEQEPEEEERALLFTLDDKEFTMWLSPPQWVGSRFGDIQRKQGALAAQSWLLEAMVSEDGYEVLLSDRVSNEQYAQIMQIVIEEVLGVDRAAPNRNGRRGRPVPRR